MGVAIIVPDEEALEPWAKAHHIKGGFKEWVKHPKVNALVRGDMERVAAEGKLLGFERAAAVYLHDDLFSVENGILTPTFKLKRPIAKKFFKAQIERLYV